MSDRIYLDTITAAKPSKAAVFAMLSFFDTFYGSSISPHAMGAELGAHIAKSYQKIYTLFSAPDSANFVFTSSSAEAISQVIYSVYKDVVRTTGKNQFVTSCIEDAAVIFSVAKLEDEGCSLKMAKLAHGKGAVSVDTLSDVISPRTCLVSLSWASALTGVVQPVAEIAKVCKERGILFHVDATQVVGKIFIDLEEIQADFITFNGEQMHALKGTGGLFAKGQSAFLHPLICGEEELSRLRGGPLNVPLLIALGQAAGEAIHDCNLYCTEVARLRDKLEMQLVEAYPEAIVLFADSERLPHISCIAFPGCRNEALLYSLSRKGVFASMGGGGFQQVELVLKAAGIDHVTAGCALTFSLSKDTTEEEIDRACPIIVDAAKRLRRLSKAFI